MADGFWTKMSFNLKPALVAMKGCAPVCCCCKVKNQHQIFSLNDVCCMGCLKYYTSRMPQENDMKL